MKPAIRISYAVSITIAALIVVVGVLTIAFQPRFVAPRLERDAVWIPPHHSPDPPGAWLNQTIADLRRPDGLNRLIATVTDGIADQRLLDSLPTQAARLPDGWEMRVDRMPNSWEQAVLLLGNLRISETVPLLMAACVETDRRRQNSGAYWSSWDYIPDQLLAAIDPQSGTYVELARNWLESASDVQRRVAVLVLGRQQTTDYRALFAERRNSEKDAEAQQLLLWASAMHGDQNALRTWLAAVPQRWPRDALFVALLSAAASWNDRQAAIGAAVSVLQLRRRSAWSPTVRSACLDLLDRWKAYEATDRLRQLLDQPGDPFIALHLRRWQDEPATAWLAQRCTAGDLVVLAALRSAGPDPDLAAWVRPWLNSPDPSRRYQAMHTLLALAPHERETVLDLAATWTERGLRDEVAWLRSAP